MITITFSFWPAVTAIAVALALTFYTFKLYDEEWGYALCGTLLFVLLTVISYFTVYGLEAYF